jgi:hypothetical protein
LGVLEGRQRKKHERHETEAAASRRRKIGGGIVAEVASGHLSSFTNTSSLLSTMRGE